MDHIIKSFLPKLLMLFMLGGAALLLLIESTFNGGLYLSLKVLSLPLAVGVFLPLLLKSRRHPKPSRWLWLGAVALYMMLMLFSWPYVLGVNALIADESPIVFRGPVIEKFTSSGARSSIEYHLRIHDLWSGQVVEVNVSKAGFKNIPVGSDWCTAFHRGLFGIPYRWRHAENSELYEECKKS
jgi:hypothetical protein